VLGGSHGASEEKKREATGEGETTLLEVGPERDICHTRRIMSRDCACPTSFFSLALSHAKEKRICCSSLSSSHGMGRKREARRASAFFFAQGGRGRKREPRATGGRAAPPLGHRQLFHRPHSRAAEGKKETRGGREREEAHSRRRRASSLAAHLIDWARREERDRSVVASPSAAKKGRGTHDRRRRLRAPSSRGRREEEKI
jgi:hypothetical protein